jgi:hypothetical protein
MICHHLNNIFISIPDSHPRDTEEIFLETNRLDHKSYHSPPCTTEVINKVDFASIRIYFVMAWWFGTGITLLILNCNWNWLIILLCKMEVHKFVINMSRIPPISHPVSHITTFQIATVSTSSGNEMNYRNTWWRQQNTLRGKLHHNN